MKAERRKDKRVPSRLPVHYYIDSGLHERETGLESLLRKFKQSGISVNISGKGLLFLTYDHIKIRDPFRVDITLPLKQKNENVSLMANIKWVTPKSDQHFSENIFLDFDYCCGIEFIDSEATTRVGEFVDYWAEMLTM